MGGVCVGVGGGDGGAGGDELVVVMEAVVVMVGWLWWWYTRGPQANLPPTSTPRYSCKVCRPLRYARGLEDAGGTAYPEDLSPAALLPSLGSTSSGVVSSSDTFF